MPTIPRTALTSTLVMPTGIAIFRNEASSLTLHKLRDAPHAPGFAHRADVGGADRRDFRQNARCQLFDGVESFGIVVQSVSGECGEPESNLGSLLR